MSKHLGENSRTRRTAAVIRAREDVYKTRGGEMPTPPFDNDRQNRIYAKAYRSARVMYWRMESLLAEMEQVYGTTGYKTEDTSGTQ